MKTFSRRTWLRSASAGVIALQSSSWLSALAANVSQTGARSPRRSCILLWMTGGPSQIDTFDPKPEHENGGPFQTIATSVPGIAVCEHLPKLAAMAGELAIIRSMTSKEGDHERATVYVQTGYTPAGPLQYPSLGAVASGQLQPEDTEFPRYVSIAPGFGQRRLGAGFLGPRFAPLVVRADQPANATETLRVSNLTPASNVNTEQFATRLDILNELEPHLHVDPHDVTVESHRAAYQQALRMMRGRAEEAFDLSREPDYVRDAYGRNRFGQGCLLARRLIEFGVPFVDVSLNAVPEATVYGWDTHADNFALTSKLCGVLDPAYTALLRDLKQRGLLESTVVVWMGEFGRTPKINPASGRDHFPNAWSAVLAGGGIRGGQVIGKTNASGSEVVDRPVQVPDLLATVCAALGVDRNQQNMSNIGRPIRVVDPSASPIQEALL